jgi:hypothetical protein
MILRVREHSLLHLLLRMPLSQDATDTENGQRAEFRRDRRAFRRRNRLGADPDQQEQKHAQHYPSQRKQEGGDCHSAPKLCSTPSNRTDPVEAFEHR